jgi:hypothetical protein
MAEAPLRCLRSGRAVLTATPPRRRKGGRLTSGSPSAPPSQGQASVADELTSGFPNTQLSPGRRSSLGPRWGICGSPTFGRHPWVPAEKKVTVGPGSTLVGPGSRTNGDGKHRSPHKTRQPWVPATSFRFCVRGATRPNCQPLTLSHLEFDGGPTVSMPAFVRPHCILPARNSETLTIFSNFEPNRLCPGSTKLWEAAQ